MKSLIQDIITTQHVQGMIIATFTSDAKILAEEVIGYQDVVNKKPINRDTLFGIASVSKSFTVLALMQLVEKGKVNLNDPVTKYITEFKNANQEPILVRHLLSHAAGYYPQHRTTVAEMARKLNIDVTVADDLAYDADFAAASAKHICALLDSQTTFCGKPGERVSYSNDGIGLVTEIVRRFGGETSYAAYMDKYVFAPLGLTHTTLSFKHFKEPNNVSKLYYQEDGVMKETADFYDNSFVIFGGGGIKSTVNDLIKYVCMYLNNGATTPEHLLSEEGLKQMQTPVLPFTHDSKYGLALSIETLAEGYTAIGHGGSLTGVSSTILWCPEKQIGTVVLCNTSNVAVGLIARETLRKACGLPAEKTEQQERVWDVAEKAAIVGEYHADEGDTVTILRMDESGNLNVFVDGQEKEFILGEQNVVYIKNKYSLGALEFYTNANNEVFSVKLGGRILPKR